jgi:Family of unknown function (DUF5677)
MASRDHGRGRRKRVEQREKQRVEQRVKQAAAKAAMSSLSLPRPDAAASPETQEAMVQIERLLRLVDFPIQVNSKLTPEPRVLENWDVVAPAMLFSAASCLLSIRGLASAGAPRREQDAAVLLRRLYEHVVTFAWIAIDPVQHSPKWVASDFHYRLKIDDDIMKLGQPGLDEAMREEFKTFRDTHGVMPDVASRADAADKHWSTQIEGHGVFPSKAPATARSIVAVQGGNWSLRTMYAIIYRSASAVAHPTPFSLSTYVVAGHPLGTFVVGVDPTNQDERFAYTLAPLIYAVMLFVAEHALGRPKRDDVEAAFHVQSR